MWQTLVDTQTLAAHLSDPNWIVFDCRFRLSDVQAGRKAYAQGHIPGAHYADLNIDLSSPVTSDTGRHPLPAVEVLSHKLGRWGVTQGKQVVVYDDSFGAMAARLWWLLRWLGHDTVAVLDGGLPVWQREGRPLSDALPPIAAQIFTPHIKPDLWIDTDAVAQNVRLPTHIVMDARSEERFRGEVEPFDSVAGHIPGAMNVPFEDNLDVSGCFLSREELRAHYLNLLVDHAPMRAIQMCGSGVTACHNVLAMEHAGLAGAKLYVGSWSEWIRDPKRPVARDV